MDSADRAERAADLADRRARDADRTSRWMIGIGLALLVAVGVQMIAIQRSTQQIAAAVETLRADVQTLRADFQEQIDTTSELIARILLQLPEPDEPTPP